MMSLRKRIQALEEGHDKPAEDSRVAEALRQIREQALHANRCLSQHEPPLFEVAADGAVTCAADGKPVTDAAQIFAERCWWTEMDRGHPGLRYDREGQALYTLAGELALSRTYVHLAHLMGDQRMRDWEADDAQRLPWHVGPGPNRGGGRGGCGRGHPVEGQDAATPESDQGGRRWRGPMTGWIGP